MRLHALEIDHDEVRHHLALTEDENVQAFLACYQLQRDLRTLTFDVFTDMRQILLSGQPGSCIWNACDPLSTPAVRNVNGLGGRSNCSRTNKDGVDWVKPDDHGRERYWALYETPWQDGGCQGCRFFFACKGQCPGTALDGDWRNRSEQCGLWYRLLEAIEADLVRDGQRPISRDERQRLAHEVAVLEGRNIGRDQPHGDHWDAPDGHQHSDGAYVVHGDQGRTDAHGDHSDA